MNVKRYINIKYILPILAIIVYFSFPIYNSYTERYLNDSLKKSLIIYASLKTLNSGISVIKNSTVQIGMGLQGELAIGEIVSPIYDSIERFSDLLTISIWILGGEKFIYEISSLKLFNFLVVILSIIFFFTQKEIIKRILIVMICLRIFIPLSSSISSYLNKQIFLPQIEKHLKIIKSINNNADFSKLATKISNLDKNETSIFGEITKKFEKISYSFKNIGVIVSLYIKKFNLILKNLFDLSILYFSQFIINIIILPFSTFYLIKQLLLSERF